MHAKDYEAVHKKYSVFILLAYNFYYALSALLFFGDARSSNCESTDSQKGGLENRSG